jgi:hypothetical protein
MLCTPNSPSASRRRRSRHGRTSVGADDGPEVEGLLDFSVDADVGEWRPRLETLFVKLRNPAVHPKAKAKPAVKHPALPTRVSPEYAIYCVEAVEDSVGLLLETLLTCVHKPRPSIETWAADSRPVVDLLNELRARLRAAASSARLEGVPHDRRGRAGRGDRLLPGVRDSRVRPPDVAPVQKVGSPSSCIGNRFIQTVYSTYRLVVTSGDDAYRCR